MEVAARRAALAAAAGASGHAAAAQAASATPPAAADAPSWRGAAARFALSTRAPSDAGDATAATAAAPSDGAAAASTRAEPQLRLSSCSSRRGWPRWRYHRRMRRAATVVAMVARGSRTGIRVAVRAVAERHRVAMVSRGHRPFAERTQARGLVPCLN